LFIVAKRDGKKRERDEEDEKVDERRKFKENGGKEGQRRATKEEGLNENKDTDNGKRRPLF